MNRREHLKLLLAGSAGAGLFLSTTGCSTEDIEESERIIAENSGNYGRTEVEMAYNERLKSETFFTTSEHQMVEMLSDIIIPVDDISGGATEAGVADFIEFMMKDIPSYQIPVRGGLMWLDNECRKRFNKPFLECTSTERTQMIDEIAWPEQAVEEMGYGVRFFNLMRNLVSTGFFTSQMGIRDLGYAGNSPGFWDGVPDEVLAAHGLSYDKKTLDECLQVDERNKLAEWDESGNLIR